MEFDIVQFESVDLSAPKIVNLKFRRIRIINYNCMIKKKKNVLFLRSVVQLIFIV